VSYDTTHKTTVVRLFILEHVVLVELNDLRLVAVIYSPSRNVKLTSLSQVILDLIFLTRHLCLCRHYICKRATGVYIAFD